MTNIFLITIDALRADRVGYINKKKNLTPKIDKFARENIAFTQAISTGPTTPLSFPSILTSEYASDFFNKKTPKKTISSIFQDKGYKTTAFNSNPHFRLWGLSKGLDSFEDFLKQTKKVRNSPTQKLKNKVTNTFHNDSLVVKTMSKLLKITSSKIPVLYADAETLNKTTINWIEKNKEKEFFCWMHYMEPHYPYLPPEKYVNNISKKQMTKINRSQWIAEHEGINKIKKEDIKKIIELYEGEVKYVDEYFGYFINKLKELNIYKNSIIFLTADHGEMLGEHGRFGHQRDVLYKDQITVPLIVKTIENTKKTINKPVSLIDIPYNMMKFADIKENYFNGNYFEKREYIISESFKRSSLNPELKTLDRSEMIVSCQMDKWKLIIDDINNKKELYNLKVDPQESKNLFKKEKDIVKILARQIIKHKIQKKQQEKKIISERILKLKKSGKI